MEEGYRPIVVKEELPSTSSTTPHQVKFFPEHDLRGLIDKNSGLEELLKTFFGKEIMVNKQILSEATQALGEGKVWGKERAKVEEFDTLVHEFFDNHPSEAFTVSKGVLVWALSSPWSKMTTMITKHLLMKKHPSYLFTPNFRFMVTWKKGGSFRMKEILAYILREGDFVCISSEDEFTCIASTGTFQNCITILFALTYMKGEGESYERKVEKEMVEISSEEEEEMEEEQKNSFASESSIRRSRSLRKVVQTIEHEKKEEEQVPSHFVPVKGNIEAKDTVLEQGSLLAEDDDFHPGVLMGDVYLRNMMSILKAEERRSTQIALFRKHLRALGPWEAFQNTLNLVLKMWNDQKGLLEDNALIGVQIGNYYFLDPLFVSFLVGMEVGVRSLVETHRWHGEALEGSRVLGLLAHVPYDLKDFWLMLGGVAEQIAPQLVGSFAHVEVAGETFSEVPFEEVEAFEVKGETMVVVGGFASTYR
eukprot:Gb_09374 [translate_table: standard]